MSIGLTIKKLRREQDMTQEQLADLLGLTPAAVSSWECDRNAPDISQIPQLAHIFGVSADTLLGIDLTAQEDKIDKIIEQAAKLTAKEAVEAYRLGLAEFPASYRLMLRLADELDYRDEPDTHDARIKERIALYERIREGTKDAYTKNYAEGKLCGIYLSQGKRDKALQIAENVPNFMFSHNDLEQMLAQGVEKIHNLHHSIEGEFMTLCDDIIFLTMVQVDGKPFFTHEQAITMLEKIPKFHEIFYENGDYLDDNIMLRLAYTRMAEHYADMGDHGNTVRCLKSAAYHAKEADKYYDGLRGYYGISDVWDYPRLPAEKRHTSILASPEFDYPTTTFDFGYSDGESHCDVLRRDVSHTRFDFVRDEIADLI